MHGTKMLPGLLAFKAGKKIGSPNGDPINELFGFTQRLSDALQPLHQAEELAFSCLGGNRTERTSLRFPV